MTISIGRTRKVREKLDHAFDRIGQLLEHGGMPELVNMRLEVQKLVQNEHRHWKRFGFGEISSGGVKITTRTGEYVRGIQPPQFKSADGKMSWLLENDAEHAAAIEYGHKRFDMKESLGQGIHDKQSADGTFYRTIFFRFGTQASSVMAPPMSGEAKAFWAKQRRSATSNIRGFTQRPRVGGKHGPTSIRQAKYRWGNRFIGSNPLEAGMVRMRANVGKQTRSVYGTFRIMSQNSEGWIQPAKPGAFITLKAANRLKRHVIPVMKKGLRKDAAKWLKAFRGA
jgi:hypothetical protein